MEEVIAEVLKDFSTIHKRNVEDILREFELRNITLERDGDVPELVFQNHRTGTQYSLGKSDLNELESRIPKINEFFEETDSFIRNVQIEFRHVAIQFDVVDESNHVFLSHKLIADMMNGIPNFDIYDYSVSFRDPSFKRIEIIVGTEGKPTHVNDQGAQVILRGASKRTLNEVKKRLHSYGFNSIELDVWEFTPSSKEKRDYKIRLLRAEMLSVPNLAKVIWTLLVGTLCTVLGFVLGRVIP